MAIKTNATPQKEEAPKKEGPETCRSQKSHPDGFAR
jgi:hypothetical protein